MKNVKWRERLLGKARDPLSARMRQGMALTTFLAWVGLGADGLSSSAYGPEEAFRALGTHTDMALWLALATAVTVFVLALAYNQVIELFPTGGGGYRVSTALLGPHAGLVAGCALVIDYALTIAISVAAGTDAIFSLLSPDLHLYKPWVATLLIVLLLWLNLRGLQESVRVLLPIFLGFVITHGILIGWGIAAHAAGLPALIPDAVADTRQLSDEAGWLFVAALILKAWSLGGGTYTGIEAVSNNVQYLSEPVVRTGRRTMMVMAASLALTAAGIILLYLLWASSPQPGMTLNAVVFEQILAEMGLAGDGHAVALGIVLLFEAGLLLAAANTGFLGGPAVLANMAADSWVPHRFRHVSSRLVTEKGILLMATAAFVLLMLTGGDVSLLVVLYSINVFLTFTLTLAGMSLFWLRNRRQPVHRLHWRRRLALSLGALVISVFILLVTVVEKFFEGGWFTLAVTSAVIGLCLLIHRHYRDTRRLIQHVDATFVDQAYGPHAGMPATDPSRPTAVFLVGSSRGGALHALLWVQRLFPDHFHNFVFINGRTVDAHAYGGSDTLESLRVQATTSLKYYERFCNSYGLAADSRLLFGTDAIDTLETLMTDIVRDYPDAIFFMSKLVFDRETLWTRLLHNHAIEALQRRAYLKGLQLMVLPMRVDPKPDAGA